MLCECVCKLTLDGIIIPPLPLGTRGGMGRPCRWRLRGGWKFDASCKFPRGDGQAMYLLHKENHVLVAEKPRVRNFAGGKSPCGLGKPSPRLAKLRVSLERHSCWAKIAQWSGPRTAVYFERKIMFLLPKEHVFFLKKNVSSSKRKCVFLIQKRCLLHTENMFSWHRKCVFLTQNICLLDTENMSSWHRKYVLFRQKICLL